MKYDGDCIWFFLSCILLKEKLLRVMKLIELLHYFSLGFKNF